MKFLLDLRLADRGGPVRSRGHLIQEPDGPEGQAAEDRLRAASSVIFLLHGFNVTRPNGRRSLRRLAELLPSAEGRALVGVLWPGDSWARAASYSFEGNDADDSARALRRFVGDVLQSGTILSFAAHSLGCRVALETVLHLDQRFVVDELALMAAAVDDYSLAWDRAYRRALARASRVSVLAARSDDVLRLAYPAGDLLQAFVFFWREEAGLALGYHGPKPHRPTKGAVPGNVKHLQIDGLGVNHGDYLPGRQENKKQRAAARWCDAVLTGTLAPRYELATEDDGPG
jgi:hypothetical protein